MSLFSPRSEPRPAPYPLITLPKWEEVLTVVVVSLSDGDSFRGRAAGEGSSLFWASESDRLDADGSIPFRIKHIDAPEKHQDHGLSALAELGILMPPGTRIHVHLPTLEGDFYKRTLAEVRVGGIDVAHAMVATGNAWWAGHLDPKFSDRADLEEAQYFAECAQEGLWSPLYSEADPLAPWEARRIKRGRA